MPDRRPDGEPAEDLLHAVLARAIAAQDAGLAPDFEELAGGDRAAAARARSILEAQPAILGEVFRDRAHVAPEGGVPDLPAIPDFRVLRLLGAGGMGSVYLAEQLSLRRLVALKV